jgi:hypothetical protein
MAKKTLFSFHLDDDLKVRIQDRAARENRSTANLIETAVRGYLDPTPRGSRVTVRTTSETKFFKSSPLREYTGRVKSVDPILKTFTLWDPDPLSGLDTFPIDQIIAIHLI